jgi:tetratricopeptide (TPR) repeat protein
MKSVMTYLFAATTLVTTNVSAQSINVAQMQAYEHQLADVMEVIDTVLLKSKLAKVEKAFQQEASIINKVRLGIIYHETALNLTFFTDSGYEGYAQKSYAILSEVEQNQATPEELLPFVTSYRASALSLVSAETKKLSYLSDAFALLNQAVAQYAMVSYLPEFLRGSIAENLPWFLFGKRKYAKKDFASIIKKYEKDPDYANHRIMSFTYWAWANQHKGRKHRNTAIAYLDSAIALDPENDAGRAKAEALKKELMK